MKDETAFFSIYDMGQTPHPTNFTECYRETVQSLLQLDSERG